MWEGFNVLARERQDGIGYGQGFQLMGGKGMFLRMLLRFFYFGGTMDYGRGGVLKIHLVSSDR